MLSLRICLRSRSLAKTNETKKEPGQDAQNSLLKWGAGDAWPLLPAEKVGNISWMESIAYPQKTLTHPVTIGGPQTFRSPKFNSRLRQTPPVSTSLQALLRPGPVSNFHFHFTVLENQNLSAWLPLFHRWWNFQDGDHGAAMSIKATWTRCGACADFGPIKSDILRGLDQVEQVPVVGPVLSCPVTNIGHFWWQRRHAEDRVFNQSLAVKGKTGNARKILYVKYY